MLERDGLIFNIARNLTPKEHRATVRRMSYDLQDFVKAGIPNLLRYGEIDMFQRVNFELNGDCNFNKCWYCPNSVTSGRNGTMSDEVFNVMIEQLSKIGQAGFRGVINPSFYGEPTAYKGDLVAKMAEIKKNLPHANIWFHTNGILLTPDLFRGLFQVGVDRFIITRHPGASTGNLDKLHAQITEQERERVVDRTLDDIKLWRRLHIVIPPERVLRLKRCHMASTQLTIAQNGDVLLCFQDFGANYVYGNIIEDSIPNIWKYEKFRWERENIRRGTYSLELCKQCMDKIIPSHN